MSNAKEVKFSLKVMINKKKTKVLFAEVDSDFVDVLLSFLTLPLGKIVSLLEKHYGDEAPVFGSLSTLYYGLSNLDSANFWTEGGKQMLLNPRSSFESECRKLKINVDDTQPTKYFRCGDMNCKRKESVNVSMYYGTAKCDCGKSLNRAMGTMEPKTQVDIDGDGGVFTEKRGSFLITDDLRMAPVVLGSIIQTLINLGITVRSGAEMKTVNLGFNEIIDLLRGSLLSNTPLTDLILLERHRTITYDVRGYLPHQIEEKSSSDSKKLIVKAILRKSDNKLLFVEAKEDFVDFLFSLLIIPFGGVERLLGSNTSLKNMDNLYKSITNLIGDRHLRTPDIIDRLMKPELPPNYLSKNQIFPLTEQMNPSIYYFQSVTDTDRTVEKGYWMRFKDPKGGESYVRRPGTFMVSDDLTVKRMDSISSILCRLNIRLSDALNILKASLTSISSFTDGLIDPILEKQQEQEN
ncbi:hypothetical protein DH2020_011533 [Rehmannia glutinosa]|uniref:DUF674 family protein n=1 Tax=Rehmannia glutinosa TaxID=99300 RepID=A0ABR0XDM6_REHGL